MPGARDSRIVVDRDSETGPDQLGVAMSDPSGSGGPSPIADGESGWSPWPAIALAIVVGTIARAAPVFAAGFPINDGGMFASMVDSIGAGGQVLPDAVTYNGLNAPFAYPPLAFLVTAGLERADPDRDGRMAALDPARRLDRDHTRVRAAGARDRPLTGPRRRGDVRVCADAQQPSPGW